MNDTTSKAPVGFIGIGVMGHSMAGHVLAAGHPLSIYTRTRSKADALIASGASWCETPRAVAAASDVVITMVGYPADVEEVYFGADGIFGGARAGALLVDMTTSSPSLAVRIHAEARRRGLGALDAPVSGGDVGAREARLAIMVGGESAEFARALPIFELMGTATRLGEAGSGQYTKMANQIAIASTMVGVCEALAYAVRAGLDASSVVSAIERGAAGSWSLSNLAPRMIAGNFAPGFYVKHFLKDMKIAVESAEELGIELPGLRLARSLYERLAADGGESFGTQALYRLYIEP